MAHRTDKLVVLPEVAEMVGIAWTIVGCVAIIGFVLKITKPAWFMNSALFIREHLHSFYKSNLVKVKHTVRRVSNGYSRVKGTPVNLPREKRDNACQNEHENMLHEISDEEGDVDAEVLRYEYGVGNVSPDTIIIEDPPSSISSVISNESDVPSPSLKSLPSIVSVLQAKGTDRLNLLEARRRRLRKGKS